MLFRRCKFCGANEGFIFPLRTKKINLEYYRCGICGGISLSEKNYLSIEEQIARYKLHQNKLEDLGYTRFLCEFIVKTFSFLPNYDRGIILDYGSGPTPSLIRLLHLVSKKQETRCDFDKKIDSIGDYVTYLSNTLPVLPSTNSIIGWDPFFASDTILEQGMASLVLCLEVAEHFENPLQGFTGLANACSVGGYVAVGTLPMPDDMSIPEGFKGWWYKDDKTHVSFYTEKAMISCGKMCGLKYLGKASPRIFIFQKLEDAIS